MTTNPDLEIARAAKLRPIAEIAAKLHIPDDAIEPYGRYKAKIGTSFIDTLEAKPDGAMVLVTAWNAWMAWAQDSQVLAAYALAAARLRNWWNDCARGLASRRYTGSRPSPSIGRKRPGSGCMNCAWPECAPAVCAPAAWAPATCRGLYGYWASPCCSRRTCSTCSIRA